MDRTTERRRLDDLDDAMAKEPPSESGGGSLVVQTATRTTYPTVAGSYYWCTVMTLSGTPTEGGAGTLTATSRHVYARNLGTAVPPVGTTLLAHPVSVGRWAIRFDG